jgi:DNA-binding transcriptional MerR regulator
VSVLIGELAASQGVDSKTIRYYESVGVLPDPERSPSGYRIYHRDDEARLRFVKAARSLDLSLGEIKEILRLRDQGRAPCTYVTQALERRLGDVDEAIRELSRLKTELVRLRRRARQLPPRRAAGRYCHILEPA